MSIKTELKAKVKALNIAKTEDVNRFKANMRYVAINVCGYLADFSEELAVINVGNYEVHITRELKISVK